jgi:hypothetical protein
MSKVLRTRATVGGSNTLGGSVTWNGHSSSALSPYGQAGVLFGSHGGGLRGSEA